MSTEGQPFLTDNLTAAFTAKLNGLCPDQHTDDLSSALWAAFEQCELYDFYVSSLVGDTGRVWALLEVFDKVCPVKYIIP